MASIISWVSPQPLISWVFQSAPVIKLTERAQSFVEPTLGVLADVKARSFTAVQSVSAYPSALRESFAQRRSDATEAFATVYNEKRARVATVYNENRTRVSIAYNDKRERLASLVLGAKQKSLDAYATLALPNRVASQVVVSEAIAGMKARSVDAKNRSVDAYTQFCEVLSQHRERVTTSARKLQDRVYEFSSVNAAAVQSRFSAAHRRSTLFANNFRALLAFVLLSAKSSEHLSNDVLLSAAHFFNFRSEFGRSGGAFSELDEHLLNLYRSVVVGGVEEVKIESEPSPISPVEPVKNSSHRFFEETEKTKFEHNSSKEDSETTM